MSVVKDSMYEVLRKIIKPEESDANSFDLYIVSKDVIILLKAYGLSVMDIDGDKQSKIMNIIDLKNLGKDKLWLTKKIMSEGYSD